MRIDSRIANRVPTRLRTRIDRNYRGMENPADAYDQADRQLRLKNVRER